MKKLIKITLIILILLICFALPLSSNASISISSVDLYSATYFENLLSWNGAGLVCNFVVYQKDGVEYPAYCLNRELPGVTESTTYSVSTEELLSNVLVWRAIINGYPYKSLSELECQTKEEAFFATKQAVYCMLYDRDPNTYSAIGEAGERTLNALKQIVNAARSSTATKISSDLVISSNTSLWEIDNIDNKCISRTFTVTAGSTINSYTISLQGTLVEGTKIVDENNNEKSTFNSNDSFKILIPITNIVSDGNFTITAQGKVATKPILYGKSADSSLQDYAITGTMYEDGTGEQKVYYTKNQTQIVIVKQVEGTKELLQGVKFQLLDKDQKVLYTELTTNKDGEIIIKNLLPGKYYIKETATVSGYMLYDKLIEIDLSLNETAKIIVNNSQEEIKIEEQKTETEIEVVSSTSETEVKLPKTGM